MTGADAAWAVDEIYAGHAYGTFPWDRRRFSRATLEALAQELRPGMVVLDLGCGSGFWLGVLRTLAPAARVHGMDRSAAALRAIGPGGFQGDVQALPCRSGSADLLLLSGVLHHVAEPERALREAARVLRPGGALVVEVYNAWHPWFWLGHRAMAPVRWCYWRGARWLLHPLRWLAGLLLQPFALLTAGRRIDRATLDLLVLDQILNPIAELFTAARLRRLGAVAGLTTVRTWTKQGGLLRGALLRHGPRPPPRYAPQS